MTLENAIKKMDSETLVLILLRIVSQFPIVRNQIITMLNHKESE